MTESDACTKYWLLARDAIARGLVTEEEAKTIARVGHRKQQYWRRHLQDLEAIVRERADPG
jgi:hypothetical protein